MFLPENLHIAHLDVLETYDNALLQKKKKKLVKFQTTMPPPTTN